MTRDIGGTPTRGGGMKATGEATTHIREMINNLIREAKAINVLIKVTNGVVKATKGTNGETKEPMENQEKHHIKISHKEGYGRNQNRGGIYQHSNVRGYNQLQNPPREMLSAPTQNDNMDTLLQQMKALTEQMSNPEKANAEKDIRMLEKQLA